MTSDDADPIWAFLRDRRDRDPVVDAREVHFRRDSLVPVLDAALGVLAATRHLVEVTEEVLREQRDRIAAGAARDPGHAPAADATRTKIKLSF